VVTNEGPSVKRRTGGDGQRRTWERIERHQVRGRERQSHRHRPGERPDPATDRWFSSCLGPTFPNRRFLLAGTANGLMDDLPFNLLDRPRAGTIMDMLSRHEISWVNDRSALDLTAPPAFLTPPALAAPALAWGSW